MAAAGFVILAIVLVGGVIGMWLRQVRRMRTVAAAAAARGWSFAERDDSLVHRFVGQPFGNGHSESCRCAIRGRLGGYKFTAFEYTYETTGYGGTGPDGQQQPTVDRHSLWVVALEGFALDLPVVSVSRKGLMRKLGAALGHTGFQTGDTAFDAVYTESIHGAPPEVLGRLLDPAVRAATLASAGSLGEHGWRIESGALLTWFGGHTRLERLDAVVRGLAAICAAFPEEGLAPRPRPRR
jgi:hypothetical protein